MMTIAGAVCMRNWISKTGLLSTPALEIIRTLLSMTTMEPLTGEWRMSGDATH